MESITLFEDIFEITALNPDGFKFDQVNRVQATGTTFEGDLLLDIHCEIYPLRESEKITLVLASTLHLDGTPADHFSYNPQSTERESSLADNYEYVMHGKVYKVSYCGAGKWDQEKNVDLGTDPNCFRCGCDETWHKKSDRFVIVAASFGGLLMRIVGEPRHLAKLFAMPDQRLYLLLKKD